MHERDKQLFHIFASEFAAMLEEFADQLEVDNDKHTPWEALRHLANEIKREEGLGKVVTHH